MAPALDALSYERSTGERRYINYRDLSVQQLGSIYERLLEFEIVRDDAGALAVRCTMPTPPTQSWACGSATRRWGTYHSRDLCLSWVNALIVGQPDAVIA